MKDVKLNLREPYECHVSAEYGRIYFQNQIAYNAYGVIIPKLSGGKSIEAKKNLVTKGEIDDDNSYVDVLAGGKKQIIDTPDKNQGEE
jgi:hypothetical protein